MSTRRVSLIITILILGIGVTWFHGKTKADSQRVQNPENGHWYQRINASMSWNGAKSYCLAQGGHLVTIGSASENAFVYNLASGAWLGATDQEQEGNWHWVTGEPWTYTNWAPYEPNNGTWPGHDGDEDYMNFTPAYPGQWNDIPDGN
ncbi:MAG: C-type lectin domain-containing protein, partial [Candidatus Methanomethylicaceae archaeon]